MTLESILTIASIFFLICIGILIMDANRFVVREYTIITDKIAKDCTFAVLADLHNKSYGRENEKLAARIEALQPDAVLIAGDMVTAQEGSDGSAALALLKRLAHKLPIYYADGNHEYKLKTNTEKFGTMYASYEKELKQLGIEPLVNEHIILPQLRIHISGLEPERRFFRRFHKEEMPAEYLSEVLGRPDGDNYRILLAHNPDYFRAYAAWGADLVISGHVHGGVARLPLLGGAISPAFRLFPKYDGGLFYEGKSAMVLSRGLGMHTLPLRFLNPGELVLVHLQFENM